MQNGNDSMRHMPWTMAAGIAAAIGFGVFFVVWNAETLRLSIDGQSVVWIPLVAFGAVWPAGERHMRAACGIVLGSIVGVAAYYGSQVVTPITAFGKGVGLGIAAAVLVGACLAWRHRVSMATAVMGFGIGAAMARFDGIRPSSGGGDVFELEMTCVVALALGILGALVLRRGVMAMHGTHPTEKLHMPEMHMPHLPHLHVPHMPHMPHMLKKGNGHKQPQTTGFDR